MNTLEDMKTNLYNLNYPGINTMSDEAIAQVFGSSNRLNFLTWVYKQLETDSTLPSQPKAKCTALAEILYENGFCSSSEKILFVTGDVFLDPLQELQICQRIFNLLLAMKSNQENAPISKPGMSLDDLDHFLNQDMNLFPEFGIMKTRSSSECKEAIGNYKKEIQSLQEEIKSLELTDGLNVSYDTSEKKYDGTILSDLENETIRFKENKESFTGLRENDNNQFIVDGLELPSTKCNETLRTLVQVKKAAILKSPVKGSILIKSFKKCLLCTANFGKIQSRLDFSIHLWTLQITCKKTPSISCLHCELLMVKDVSFFTIACFLLIT